MSTAVCPACTKPAELQCSRCKDMKYCSLGCQRIEYGSHKLLCKTFSSVQERPNEQMRRCIFFPPDQSEPEWLWLPIKDYQVDGEDNAFQQVDYTSQMGNNANMICPGEKIPVNLKTLQPLTKHIYFAYDDMFLSKFQDDNKAVIAATKGGTPAEWRGPLLAFCGEVNELCDIVDVKDMGMMDYRALVAFLKWYGGRDPVNIWDLYRDMIEASREGEDTSTA